MGEHEQADYYLQLAICGDAEPAPAIFYNDQSPDKIAYQAFALLQLDQAEEADKRLNRLIIYAQHHIDDEVKIDYFAVSLPDLVIFDDDLNKRNRIHCLYMQGLGHLGLQRWQQAREFFQAVLKLDASHQGALIHLQLAQHKMFGLLVTKEEVTKQIV